MLDWGDNLFEAWTAYPKDFKHQYIRHAFWMTFPFSWFIQAAVVISLCVYMIVLAILSDVVLRRIVGTYETQEEYEARLQREYQQSLW